MKKELTNPACRITINLGSYSVLKEVVHNSLPLKCSLHIVTSFQRVQHAKGHGGEGHFIVEKPSKHNQVIKVNINQDKSYW